MKTNYLLLLLGLLLISSCDTNDNNDPAVQCDADFYTLSTSSYDPSQTQFGIFKYPKSNTLSTPVSLTSGNTFANSNSILGQAKTSIDEVNNKIAYFFPFDKEFIIYDIANNTLTQSSLTGVTTPEYLNGNLYFIQESNAVTSSYNTLSADFSLVDENFSAVSTPASLDFTGTGYFNGLYLISTTDKQDKIFLMANTKLIIYDKSTDTWTDFLLETYNDNTNKVFYMGIEYVDASTLLALRGNVTNSKLELIKIDLSAANPSISVKKDLSDLSVSPLSIINGHDGVCTEYDDCDNSFYFIYNSLGNTPEATVFEIKLNSNNIIEYPQNQSFLWGLDKL